MITPLTPNKATRTRRVIAFVSVALALVLALPALALAANQYTYERRWPTPTWQLNKPHGIAVDAANNVYVADTMDHRIVKYNAAGVMVKTWGGEGSANGQFEKPYGVAVDPSGQYVYVADTYNHRIQKFTSDGTFLVRWGSIGGPNLSGSGSGEFKQPEGIAVDRAGYVYVADTGNSRIQKFSPMGGFVTKWGAPGSGEGQFVSPASVAVDDEGHVFVADRDNTNCYVESFDLNGNFITKWGGYNVGIKGSNPSNFYDPAGIAVINEGTALSPAYFVYVADMLNHRVTKFDENGGYQWTKGIGYQGDTTTDGWACMQRPTGLATTVQEGSVRLLVCDTDNDRIREFDSAGTALGIRGSHGKAFGRYDKPSGIAVDNEGNVYVADMNNYRVQKTSSSGVVEIVQPSDMPPYAMPKNSYFQKPVGAAVDGDGFVYVLDAKLGWVQRFSSYLLYEYSTWTKWGWNNGTGDGWFTNPMGVAAGGSGAAVRVYVADTDNNRIQFFDRDGTFIGKWGLAGGGNGQFNKPAAVAYDVTRGFVYVADTLNHRIQKFTSGGTFLAKWGIYGSANGQFKAPAGVAVDADGNVYVADTDNNRLQKFDPSGTWLATWGTAGSEAGQLLHPRSLAVSSAGQVFVADTDNDRVEAFSPPVAIAVTGVENGKAYAGPVTPSVAFYGANLQQPPTLTLNGQAWVSGTTITHDGSYTLHAYASDTSGNSEEKTVSFVIDTQAPTSSASIGTDYNNRADLTFSATDVGAAGIAHMWVSVNGGTAVDTLGHTFSVTQLGTFDVQYWAADRAGNEEVPHSATLTVHDTQAPTTTCLASGQTFVDQATISLTASDGSGSGVVKTQYQLDGGAWKDGSVVSTSSPGSHLLKYRSVDYAGNWETAKGPVAFKIVKSTSLSITQSAKTVGYAGKVTLGASLKYGSGSGLTGKSVVLYRSIAGGAFLAIKTFPVSSTGTYAYTDYPTSKAVYYFAFAEDATCQGATSARDTVAVYASVGTPRVPAYPKAGRASTAWGTIAPKHYGYAVKIMLYRLDSSGRWVYKKTYSAKCSYYNSTTSKYAASMTLYRGRYRVRAYHYDAYHAAKYSSWSYMRVP